MDNKEKSKLQADIVNSLPLKPHCRLILAPRSGKTKLMIDVIKKNKPKSILWVTPNPELFKAIEAEFITWKAKRFLPKLTLSSWAGLSNVAGEYEMIILDEEQFITENNSINLQNGVLKYDYIVSMTGTKSRDKTKIEIYKKLNLEVFYSLTIDDASDNGILADYEINVIYTKFDPKDMIYLENKTKGTRYPIQEESMYLSVTHSLKYAKGKAKTFHALKRMHLVHNAQAKFRVAHELLSNLPGRKLVYCSNIKQANHLTDKTYHSKTTNEKLHQFMNNEIDLLAMVNAGGVGFTFRNVDHLVMIQTDSDNNGLTSQKITRALLAQSSDYKAKIWIVCLNGTVDAQWVQSTLKSFNPQKINHITSKNYLDEIKL